MLVSVHADQSVAQHVSRLQVRLYAVEQTDEREPVEDRSFYLAGEEPKAGEVSFPFSFLVLKGQEQRFRMVVHGYHADSSEPVIEQKVIASFRAGRTELLRVLLADVCYELSEPCLALDETCSAQDGDSIGAGKCGSVPVAQTERAIAGVEVDAKISWPEAGGRAELESGAGDEEDAQVDSEAGVVREAGPERDAGMDGGSMLADASDGAAASSPGSCGEGQVRSDTGSCRPDYCGQQPCLNGGRCVESGNGRRCDCSAVDFEGQDCETRINDCASQPCLHGGRCLDRVRSYECDCTDTGFEGPTCATNVNECLRPNVCAGTRSGVTFSYPCQDHDGENVGYSCPGMFSDWPITSPAARFTETSTGVMRDARTGLFWQKMIDAVDRSKEGASSYCTGLTLAGGGFRLPTRAELDTITDLTLPGPSAIDQNAFPHTPPLWFWTSSPHVGKPGAHWVVHFLNGSFHSELSASATARVRCVRAPAGGT